MSERIKSNSIQKILNEEKQLLQSEVAALNAEKEKMNNLVQKLEDRDKNSDAAVAAAEKELSLKQQMFEMHKKKVHISNHVYLLYVSHVYVHCLCTLFMYIVYSCRHLKPPNNYKI